LRPYDEKEYKDDLGVKELWGEKGFTAPMKEQAYGQH
jgi:hypothetical protein